MRERGLSSVIKLASNEGPWGPLPGAAAAIANGIDGLNRYPDGSAALLKQALAERHGVEPAQVAVGHGADSIINNLSLAMLDPGDEVLFGWPSFPSYFLDAKMMGAVPVMVPLDANQAYDLDAMLAKVTPRTRIAYVCNPNNPTGTMSSRERIADFLERLPEHVLPVLDEAYFEYVQSADYADGIEEFAKVLERPVVVLRTFSKIFGLAGLRVGYAIAPPEVVRAIDKVRNAFDVTSLAQAAALASLEELPLLDERIAANQQGLASLTAAFRELGMRPVESVANFVCVLLDVEGRAVYEQLLDHGVIVRPLDPFGMKHGLRVTVGTPEENARAIEAFRAVMPALSPA